MTFFRRIHATPLKRVCDFGKGSVILVTLPGFDIIHMILVIARI